MRALVTAALFCGALAVPFALRWWRARRWGLPVRVVVDPEDPRPEAICGYLAEIARRLDERPERMRIAFDGRTADRRAIALDVERDRTLRVSVAGRRSRRIDLRGRWIADHPVPLALRRTTLYVEPVDANRFRVMSSAPFSVPPAVYAVCSAGATAGLVWVVPELLAICAGAACGGAWAGAFRRRHFN